MHDLQGLIKRLYYFFFKESCRVEQIYPFFYKKIVTQKCLSSAIHKYFSPSPDKKTCKCLIYLRCNVQSARTTGTRDKSGEGKINILSLCRNDKSSG